MLVQMERQIDREIAADNKANGILIGAQADGQQNYPLTDSDANNTLFDTDSDEEEDSNEPVLMYGPQPQIITNDLKSLDEMVSSLFLSQYDNNQISEQLHFKPNRSLILQVRDLVEKCTCPSQFPMIRESEGKYRIGDTKVLIFVRVSIVFFLVILICFL